MNAQIAAERGGHAGRRSRKLTALAAVLVLTGCAQTPDWVNPVNWVDGMFDGNMFDDMFSEEVEQLPPAPKTAAATPGADKPFPKLGQTPVPPKSATSADDRKNLANSLVADRDSAKYTNQDLRAGDQRMAAAPPPPKPMPVPVAKPAAPSVAKAEGSKKMAAIPAVKGTAARSTSPSLPQAPTRLASDANARTRVPSIIQRRGSPQPPPAPIAEVSRKPIPRIVQNSRAAPDDQQMAAHAALPQAPAAMAPAATAPAPSVAAAMPAPRVALPTAPQLIPPSIQVPAQAQVQTASGLPSVQVNLPLGQDQSILAQTFASSLAAQGSPVVRRPGNVFNAPSATPIGGQWPTVVPGVVQQAFNASLDGTERRLENPVGGQTLVIASPQMSNDQMRRLPGAPGLIRFRHGSTRLTGKEKKYLKQVAEQARRGGNMVYVVGHASQRTGDMAYAKHKMVNFNLSLDRANAVAKELRRRGMASDRIVVQAKGDREPLYFEFMPDGEAKNRRVEVYVR